MIGFFYYLQNIALVAGKSGFLGNLDISGLEIVPTQKERIRKFSL